MAAVMMRMLIVLLLQMTGQSVANVVVGDRRWLITVDAVVSACERWTITARGLL